MLIYAMRWRPSWISDRRKKYKICRGPSNDHSWAAWVLYKLYVFCSDMKFTMAATAGLSLTLDPIWKMFQNTSSLKPLGQLKPSCPGMIIGRSSTNFIFFTHRIQCKTKSCRSRHFEFHIGTKNVKFVEDHPMNIHVQFGCNNICSFSLECSLHSFCFFMPIENSRWPLPQDID
jgi:hypothetical protein